MPIEGSIRIPVVLDDADLYTRLDRMEEHIMGAITDFLTQTDAKLSKVTDEIKGLINSLSPSAEDQATIDQINAKLEVLDTLVPDAVTAPLPDPAVDPSTLDPNAPDVIDPNAPLGEQTGIV